MNWKFILVGALALVAIGGIYFYNAPTSQPASYLHFMKFCKQYERKYKSPHEVQYRLDLFRHRLEFIAGNISKDLTYKLAINKFADFSVHEFRTKYLVPSWPNPIKKAQAPPFVFSGPREKNWIKEGKVTPVKSQGPCSAGWAFATTGAIESAFAIRNHLLKTFSEQELVDCSSSFGNLGCQGGFALNAFKYVKEHPISLSKNYPYVADTKLCQNLLKGERHGISTWSHLRTINAAGLVKMINESPVVVPLEVNEQFVFYSSGIFTSEENIGSNFNFEVLAVGYKIDGENSYFIIKNSWGEDWGEKGYMRISFGKLTRGTSGMINNMNINAISKTIV